MLHVWYIRNAKQLSSLTDVCDIDEFEQFVVQYAKVQALLRDKDPTVAEEKAQLNEMEEDMTQVLTDMAPDQNNELMADTTHYSEHN